MQIEEPVQSPQHEQQEETIHVAISFSASPPEPPACKQRQESEPAQNQYMAKEDVQHQARAQRSEDVQYQERRQQAMNIRYQERIQQSQDAQYRARERQPGDDQRRAGEQGPTAGARSEPQREQWSEDVRRELQREQQYERADHSSKVQGEPQSIQWDKIPGLFMSPQLANSSPKKLAEPASDKEAFREVRPALRFDEEIDEDEEDYLEDEDECEEEDYQEVRPALRFDEEIDEDEDEYEEENYPEDEDEQELSLSEPVRETSRWRPPAHYKTLTVSNGQIIDVEVQGQQTTVGTQALIVSSTAVRQPSAPSARYLARKKRMNRLWSSLELRALNEAMEEIDKARWGLTLKIEKIDNVREKLVREKEHWDHVWEDVAESRREQFWTKEEEFYEQNGYRRYKYPKPVDRHLPPERCQAEEPVEERQGEVLSIEEYKAPQQLNQWGSQEESYSLQESPQEGTYREEDDALEVVYCKEED
ncbi:MAG TPA: hypothetical protein VGN34_03915, partial [Ktedonobacteraceae bacterium]